ncbi:MAG: cytidine deaminase [Clostridia bacterium]|nr:cytidine deaminase [Clostridia bacterium]MBQ6883393.1 cytidine deaminase [Clostridia bacterium]
MTDKELLLLAIKARESSYSPYSGFAVGAALLTRDGKVYTGANIENAAYTPTICAERVAFFKAVNSGERDFVKIAVVGGKLGEVISSLCAPCGVCRQVMAEFCRDDFVIVAGTPDDIKTYTLKQILPDYFGPKDLK